MERTKRKLFGNIIGTCPVNIPVTVAKPLTLKDFEKFFGILVVGFSVAMATVCIEIFAR